MTVSTLTTYNEAAAGGTVYYFTFRCDDASWVKTYIGGVLQSSGITVALNADQEASPGGSVTFGSATASTVRIERETPLTQATNYTAYDAFPAETHELALDKGVMQVQDEARDRADAVAAEALARAAADQAIIDSGVVPTNVNVALVTATGSTEARTVADRFADAVNVLDFGAVGDGVADDTAAIQDAITHAKTLTCPTLVLPGGAYLASDTLTFDLPDGSTIVFIGKIVSTVSAKPAVRIGNVDVDVSTLKLRVEGLKVSRSSVDMDAGGTTSNSTGVSLSSLALCYIDIREVWGFTDGVFCQGLAANGGFSYNEIHLGQLHDNKRNLSLYASGVGYCNENNLFGGSFNHSSNYPNYTDTVNIQINHFASNWLNNNRFFGPSLEGNDAATLAAVINGDSNVIYHPRLENPDDQTGFAIYFDTNSRYCAVVGVGFDVRVSNFVDYGLGNSYEARDGSVRKAATGTGATEATLKLQGTVSAAAKLLSLRDTAGDEYGYADGQGRLWLADRGYFHNGIRFLSTDGTYNDQGIYIGTGTPEAAVAAQPGSVYVRRDGGAGTNVYAKVAGDGDTGWSPVPTQAAAVPDGSTVNTLLAALRASGVIAT